MFKKILKILREVVPILIMIGLIPLVSNDYWLTLLYILIIVVALVVRWERGDLLLMSVGFVAMIISESIFVSTGVETFVRNSLFGLMPLWLPFLWAYAFVVMRRSIKIIGA